MTPTPEQQGAVDAVLKWMDERANTGRNYFTLGGLAGTGKSTVIGFLLESSKLRSLNPAVAAFTGKAASVLRSRNIAATTLHSLMYTPEHDPVRGKTVFLRRESIPNGLVLVDEASMVSRWLFDDLMSFHVPVIFVGDHGQLEPLGDNPNLMRTPDIVLETIHRQAAGSPIIQFAHDIRRGKQVARTVKGELEFGGMDAFLESLATYDAAICGYNQMRCAVNEGMREYYEYGGKLAKGDRVVCLRNNRKLALWNGLMARVTEVVQAGDEAIVADILIADGREMRVSMLAEQFGNAPIQYKATDRDAPYMTYWDYAYAITCHKAQGSEWDSVAVLEQIHPEWDRARWSYTAATRAKKKLLYCR
jgi:exodeoxyribonuclease-5